MTQAKWWPKYAKNVDFVLLMKEGDVMIGESLREEVGTDNETLAIEPSLEYTPERGEFLELELVVERAVMGCHLAVKGYGQ